MLPSGGLWLRVWIQDPDRKPEAEAILRSVLTTRESEAVCPACGYELLGHRGAIQCPECGFEVTAEAAGNEIACPDCGEPGPRGFEVCWHCGAAVEAEPPPATSPPLPGIARGCDEVPASGISTGIGGQAPVGGWSPRPRTVAGLSPAGWTMLFLITLGFVAVVGWWFA